MNVLEEIVQRLSLLPQNKQERVLTYVSGLEAEDDLLDDPKAWSEFSLARAIDECDDDGPDYTLDDLKERFR